MKQIITATVLLISTIAFAQVGINNTSPKATLDITAKTNGTKPEGLIIPQLTGDQIRAATTATPTPVYGSNQKGLIVYASTADSAPAGATASITAPGYYYFDGSAWQKIATGNTLNTSLASGNILVGNASNVATAVMPTGDVAISNTGATSIGAGKVTNTHMASAAALTVKGNATNAAASPTDIAAGTDGYVLRRSGTALGFGTVDTAGITDGAVTTNKILDATVANADLATGTGGVYKGSGSLAGNTTVAQNANTLDFTSTATSGTSHFTVDGTTLNVDAVNNRVGIGTSAPSSTLEINSGTSNTSGLKFTNLNSSTTVGTGQALGVDTNGNVITVPNLTGSNVTTSEAFSTGGSFNTNDLGWTVVAGSSQTITVPVGGKALFLNFMLGIDYAGYPAGGGYAYYTTKLFIDNVATNVFQSTQESSPGAQAQFNLSSVKFLSAGSHTVDVRMMRTSNNGTTSGANMPCGTISMSFNASYIN